MVARVYADRSGGAPATPEAEPDQELESEVQAVAAWFEALPPEWQRYFDREAESGRQAYGQA
jgi:hypothetical protein